MYTFIHYSRTALISMLFFSSVQFDGAAGERLCHACSAFAANQAKGDKLLKEWKRKNERFRAFIKVSMIHQSIGVL